MVDINMTSRLFIISIITALCAGLLATGCRARSQAKAPPVEQLMDKLRSDWEIESSKFRDSKSFSSQKVEILAKLLRASPGIVTEREFERIRRIEIPALSSTVFDYDKTLLEALILNATKRRDA